MMTDDIDIKEHNVKGDIGIEEHNVKGDIDIKEHDMKDEIDIEEHDVKDDIDIEEHDVLDNPRIRTIFPDLAQIKKEISGDYHNLSTHNVLKEHNYCKVTGTNLYNVLKEHNYCKVTKTSSDSRMEHHPYSKSEDSRQHDQEDTSEYARFGNKITLGSKPSSTLRISEEIQNGESVFVLRRKSVEIKQEAEENEETTEEIHHPEDVHQEKYNSVSTVLILKSTPSSHDENELAKSETKFFDQEIDLNCEDNDSDHDIDTNEPKDLTAALVLLENWGPRLQNSSCYCKECLILFPTSNTLLAHNITAHSLVVAVDKNKAVKSIAKPNVKKVLNDSGKFCNDCNKMFPDSESHIDHLYEKMTFDKSNAVFNSSSKTVLPKQLEDDGKFGSLMQVYDQEAFDLFQCQICNVYLEYYRHLDKHMINNHSKTEFSQEKVLFNGTCLLCNTKFKDILNYNKHINLLHPEVYKYKGTITMPKGQVEKKLVARKNDELAKSKTKFIEQEIDLNCEDNDSDHDIDTNDPKDLTAALVLVENLGPRLQNSSCFCKECLILFPTSNTLLAHNKTAHSLLVAVDKNKAVNSTAKPNVKKVSNDTNHLYEKITFDKNNAVFKPQPNPSNKTILPKQLEDYAEFDSEMQVYDQEGDDLFQCQICSVYLEYYRHLDKHMINNHSKTEFSQEKVLFNGTCLLCNTKFKDILNYNKHINLLHPEVYKYKGTITMPKGQVDKKLVARKNDELAKSKTKFIEQEIDLNCEDNDSDHDIDTNDPKDLTAALVLVENLGPRLQNSSCFCKECLILFPTSNTLLAHNKTAHSLLVAVDKNKAVNSTAKPNVKKVSNDTNHLYEKITFDKNNAVFKPQPNPSNKTVLPKQLEDDAEFDSEMQVYDQEGDDLFQCQVCGIYHKEHGYFVNHMINFHSKTEFNEEKVLFNSNCLLCNSKLKNRLTYSTHVQRYHPEVYNYKGPLPQAQVAKKLVAKKIPISKVVPNTQIKKIQYQLIAKDTEKNSDEVFTSTMNTENEDSLIDKDDDTSESNNKNAYKIKSYQCGKCKSCFNSCKNIEQHYSNCESIQPNKKCNQCQLMFLTKNSLNTHINRYHRSDNFKFYVILVNYDEKSDISQVMKSVSSNKPLDKDDDTSESKNKNAKKLRKLYQCSKCKTCFISNRSIKQHYEECESIQPSKKCDQCQLMFLSNKSLYVHINRHHRSDNFKFLVILVNCDEKSAISRVVKTVSSNKTLDTDDDTSESKNKKANMLSKLYQCGKCKSCFHSCNNIKQHYAECQSFQPNKKCDHCQLRFQSKKSLTMHINRHHKIDNFKFRVVLVNYDEKAAMSRVVKTVSSKKPLDKDDDISESINKNANKLRKLSSLYQCGKCRTCFISNTCIKQHYVECVGIQPNKKCDQCLLMFRTKKSLSTHINLHHRSENFKFHVILVNYNEKSALSRVVKTVSSNKLLDKDDDTSESKNKNAKKLSKLYQCGKCKTCFISNSSIKQHYEECESIQPSKKCDQCQLMFLSNKSFYVHINRHHSSDNFKFNVILVNYDEKSAISRVMKTVSSKNLLEISENVSTLDLGLHQAICQRDTKDTAVREQCQLKFSKNGLDDDDIDKDDEIKELTAKDTDEKSNEGFTSPMSTENEDSLIDTNDDTSESNNKNANRNKLYQCGKCESCFICWPSIKKHYVECEGIKPNKKCDLCQLMFHSKLSLSMHINRNHRNDNFKFYVILVDYDEKSAITRVVKTVSLNKPLDTDDDTSEGKNKNANKLSKLSKFYQCGKCKTCFTSIKRIGQHYAECESVQSNKKCDKCRLKFLSKISLTKHKNRHHRSDNFKFHVILVNYDEKSAISRVVKTVSSKKQVAKCESDSPLKGSVGAAAKKQRLQ